MEGQKNSSQKVVKNRENTRKVVCGENAHCAKLTKKGGGKMDTVKIGNKLRELRGDLTAAEVAELVGTSVSAILMYEQGKRTPRDEIKVRLADLYGVSVGSLFFNS